MSGPLAGVRVLDLSSYIAGPYGCTLLADLGADVVKIEAPDGDTLRKYPSTLKADSRAFLGVNRGKRGLVVDLKRPEGKAVLMRPVGASDVLVHNFRPAVPPRLGIDYAALKTVNRRLVYCGLTGYGKHGPMRDKAGYDQVLQALTGMCVYQGASPAEPQILYGSIVDYYAASMLAFAVSSALFERSRTGVGCEIDVSLLRSAMAMQSARYVWAESEPREVGRDMRSGGVTGIHPTKEGSLYLSANTPRFWKDLCELTGLAQLAADERYDSVKKRAQRAAEIVPRLRAALATRTALEWEARFGERVPCAAARGRGPLRPPPGRGGRAHRDLRAPPGRPLPRFPRAGALRRRARAVRAGRPDVRPAHPRGACGSGRTPRTRCRRCSRAAPCRHEGRLKLA